MSHRELVKAVINNDIKTVEDIIDNAALGIVDYREPKVRRL
jgi:hypothetical protein